MHVYEVTLKNGATFRVNTRTDNFATVIAIITGLSKGRDFKRFARSDLGVSEITAIEKVA